MQFPRSLAGCALATITCLLLASCGGSAAGSTSATQKPQTTGATNPGRVTATPGADTRAPAATSAPAAAAVTAAPAAAATAAPAADTSAGVVEAPPVTVNPYTSTSEDNRSTFAMDVDTASYTSARSYLENSQLPPAEAVRVEEFVNYFRYEYPSPDEFAFGVSIDSAPSPFGLDATQLVRIGVQGQRVDASQRPNAMLTFVIDISGSMQVPDRLPLAVESLRVLLDELREGDQIGIVAYGSTARVLLEHTDVTNRQVILQALQGLGDGGSTDVEGGLRLGYELANSAYNPAGINRVILCSDGVANVGPTGPDAILETIRAAAQQNIYLTTVGFGMGGYNDYMMEQLADDGNGNYAYVDTLAAARRIFVESLSGTLQVIARDAKIQVEFDPAVVESYRLLGYENREVADVDFRNNAVDAGEVGAGHSVTALYELRVKPIEGTALTVRLRYQNPTGPDVVELEQAYSTTQFGQDFASASPRLQLAVGAAAFAEQLRGSVYARDRSLAAIRLIADRIAPQLADDTDVQEFAQLVARAEALR
ncbi:MAG: von Willebrand factor type A domain-containing protein [Roseiflexaceae bacterium]|nr:von Willebrand factor type A domain-containing protein [Roseiflexaceae bacterium]